MPGAGCRAGRGKSTVASDVTPSATLCLLRRADVPPSATLYLLRRAGTTTAHVCGNNALGAVVSTFCTDLAIAKAKAHGTAMVVCNHSNHFGIAGFYSMRAMEHGLLGMAFTNTSPFVVPTRAMRARTCPQTSATLSFK